MDGPKRRSELNHEYDEQLLDAAKRGDLMYLRSLLRKNFTRKILSEALAEAIANNQKKAGNIIYSKLNHDISQVLKYLAQYRVKYGIEDKDLYTDRLLSLIAHNNGKLSYDRLVLLIKYPGVTKDQLDLLLPYYIDVANPPFTREEISSLSQSHKRKLS